MKFKATDFWNERYGNKEFAYGEKANEYLIEKLIYLKTGKILFPWDGEGRNSVFAAKLGWKVDAFDFSESGIEKAKQLANSNNVNANYEVATWRSYNWEQNKYDAVAIIYAHMAPQDRMLLHLLISDSLKKGGVLILEAFAPNQLKFNSGGPGTIEMLYTIDDMKNDFLNFDFQELYITETILDEGKFHSGKAEVIRVFATKK